MLRPFIASLCLLSLVACGDDDDRGPDMSDASTDSSTASDTMTAEDTTPGSCTDGIPMTALGGRVGDSFVGFELQSCDDETVDFYGDGFCDATLTVLSFAAGWCGPCIIETSGLAALNEAYRDRGVRIIQVLIQKPDYSPADLAYCSSWVDRFGLTNIEVIDPADTLISQLAIPGMDLSLPLTVLIGPDGVIKARQEGVVNEELPELRSAIDDALGMPTTVVGLGEACGGTNVCASSATCSSETMVCVPRPELLAACEGATPLTLEPGTSMQMVNIAAGRGGLTATCGQTPGMEALFDLTVPEGSYDLVVSTDTPTNQAVAGLDTILYFRNVCIESTGELCNDDITPGTSAADPGNLFSAITVENISAGVHTLGVELWNGMGAPADVEVSIELRAR